MSDSDAARPFDGECEVEQTGDDTFTAHFPNAFGGATLAAATLAAGRTCRDKTFRSSHIWFLRPVPTTGAITLRVERVRDGRLLAHRRVQVVQDDRLLAEFTASFGAASGGVSFGDGDLRVPPPLPENLPREEDVVAAKGWTDWGQSNIQWRLVGNPRVSGPHVSTAWEAWARPRTPLVDDPTEHAAALAYMTDNHSDWSAGKRIADFDKRRFSSLDNAIWVHRWSPWTDWWFIRARCDVAQDGFTFSRRKIYGRDGRLIASATQEAYYAG